VVNPSIHCLAPSLTASGWKVLALDAGIGWLWASLGLLMATRASTLLARFASDRWVVARR
jgi:hypothetical protein